MSRQLCFEMAPVKDEKCAITGKPAKYRDPLTGLPYADLAAFKAIREQHTSAAAAVDRELDISHQEDMKRKHEAAAGQDSKRVRHGDDDADQQDKSNGRDDDGGLALSSNDCQAIREFCFLLSVLFLRCASAFDHRSIDVCPPSYRKIPRDK